MKVILEVCCGTYQDAIIAIKAGAKRIEMNQALFLGGLTPNCEIVKKLKKDHDIEIVSMVRPRGSGFNYTDLEFEQMLIETKALLEANSDGIAVGILTEDFQVDEVRCQKIIDLCNSYQKYAVFTRAFDLTTNKIASLKTLEKLKFKRILTSAGKEKVTEDLELLKTLVAESKEIEILAGSGVNSKNVLDIIEKTKVTQVHSSCKKLADDRTATNQNLSFAYLKDDSYELTDYEEVKNIINALKKPKI